MRRRLLSLRYSLIPLLAVILRLVPGPRTVDDAFITFRYARNLLAGHGLVYNPGELVLGTTTPLYALLLSAIGLVTGGTEANFPIIALIVNSAFDALTCYILIRIGESLRRALAGNAAALIWAIAPMSVTFSIGGMETSLLICLMMGTFYFHIKNQHTLTALLAAFSLLTRPDAAIFLLPLAIDRGIQWFGEEKRSPALIEILSFGVPIAIWVIVSTAAYGSPIPQSIVAKSGAYILPRDAALIRLLQHFATPFFGHEAFGIWWIGLGLLIYPTLHITGWRGVIQSVRRAWPLAIFPALYLFVYAYANPLIFRWYLTPPLPMYFLGIFLGIERLGVTARRQSLSPILALATVLLSLNAWTLHPDHGNNRPAPQMAYVRLEGLYRQAAERLSAHSHPQATLAAGDIGVLGYDTNLKILDTVGLISPESTKYYPVDEAKYVINYAIPSKLILDQLPDFIVVLEVYVRETFLKEQSFTEQYKLLSTLETDIYGSKAMLIFERR